jgi:hypothetical protein
VQAEHARTQRHIDRAHRALEIETGIEQSISSDTSIDR